ncbi:MAG: hypothetical protein U5L00_02705 [Desulfovermiculus sp.]|nr:hypothetical protein [Desulfovermiculus sp.]
MFRRCPGYENLYLLPFRQDKQTLLEGWQLAARGIGMLGTARELEAQE